MLQFNTKIVNIGEASNFCTIIFTKNNQITKSKTPFEEIWENLNK